MELRGATTGRGLDDQHHLAVVAILSALSHTADCTALAQAARSVEKLVQKPVGARAAAAAEGGLDDTAEVFALFVRRLVGRAAQVCTLARDFRSVRRPIREVLQRVPALGGKTGKLSNADAHRRIAEIIEESCQDEAQAAAVSSDCAEVEKGYTRLCIELSKQPDYADEAAACQIMKAPPP